MNPIDPLEIKQSQEATRLGDDQQNLECIIEVQNLSKSYKVGNQLVVALKDVSLKVFAGEILVILGESGSGKSTLLQCLGCVDKPSDGSVSVNGIETRLLSDTVISKLRRDSFGFVFQSFFLQPFLTLLDNVCVPAMFTSSRPQEIQQRATNLLKRVGLTQQKNRLPHQLSGGQIQRAAIARALVNNPKVLLADEPTGNLDSENSRLIVELFQQLREDLGTTIIIVTHDASVAQQADRIIRLRDGAII